MNDMVEVIIDSIRVGLMSQNRVVILREVNADRYLAIWIDAHMAGQITFALQDIEVARPMSHDLMKHLIQALNARIVRVEVVELKNEVFYGNIVIETDGGHLINLDSRTSDALALAVRTNVPILVARQVMDEAGIIPEEDITDQAGSEPPATDVGDPSSPEGDDRLSIFKDFLENLELDEDDQDEDQNEEN